MDHLNRPLVVAAIGGNALLRRGQPLDHRTQVANVRVAGRALSELARHSDLAIVHGNGPQVGLLAQESELGPAPMPLDVLDAETQGQIGYLLSIELSNQLSGRHVATLLTQVEVEPHDPAFAIPTKPIGAMLDKDQAERLARERGWSIGHDGDGWRRVVASPDPVSVVELEVIRLLLDRGVVVVCGGGGGVPVTRSECGLRSGVEAVIDNDLTAALLASALGASKLLLLTDVDAVYDQWATPLSDATVEELRSRSFAPGSMGPKVEAACRFVTDTGRSAAVGALDQALAACRGLAGTQVWP